MVERVYIANASGYVANVDGSGNLAVNASVTVPPVTTNISGQAVFLGSGSFAPLSGLFVNISGQGVTASVTTNISGQAVFLGSGSFVPLSGLFVQISGQAVQATANISGQNVVVSSGAISVVSGEVHVMSGAISTSVSGNVVYTTSGQNLVQIASGFNQVTVSGSITTSVSGQNVVISSGAISVVSGEVHVISGSVVVSNTVGVTLAGTTVSGSVQVSGTVSTSISGQNVVISSGAISVVSGEIHVMSGAISATVSGGVTVSGSVQVSGTVITSVSGNYVNIVSGSIAGFSGIAVSVSGNTVNATLTATGLQVSGAVGVSGSVSVMSGSITINSGQVAISGIFAGLSGGAGFQSGAGAVSGAIPVIPFAWDFSGGNWSPLTIAASGNAQPLHVTISGDSVNAAFTATGLQVSGAVAVSGAVSLQSGEVHVISGSITTSVSGQNVVVSSGAISVVSGSVTVNSGAVVLMSGTPFAWTQGTICSGGGGMNFSGAGPIPAAMMVYDYSGQVWMPAQGISASGYNPNIQRGIMVGGAGGALAQQAASVNALAGTNNMLLTSALIYGNDPLGGAFPVNRVTATTSGDWFRLRVSAEGQAPTYTINAYNIAPISGGGAGAVGPLVTLFNYGSGTAIQSGSAYKIKGLYIAPDPANTIISGQPIKFDVIRYTAFSGGGTLTSGTAHDTRDPAYSGTLAGPTLQTRALSGYTLDGFFFSYITTTAGPWVNQGTTLYNMNATSDPYTPQNTNLIQARMTDTKEIIIRSGYGFAVIQSSGNNYTQVFSGTYNFSLTYSVEGMTYTN